MLSLRRIALHALKAPSPWFAPQVSVRSITSLRTPRLIQSAPITRQIIARRWASEGARPSPETEDGELEQTGDHPQEVSRQPLDRSLQDIPPSEVIYVGNLFYDVTDADLRREFEKIAPVKSCQVVFDRRGLSKGHGYVEYETKEDAARAIQAMNQQVFEGRRMMVNYQIRAPTPRRPAQVRTGDPSRTLFIGNMSYDMTDQDLNDLFREIRNVIDVRVAIDRRTGTPKGFAHADFTDVASAEAAMRVLEQKKIYGRQLRVDFSISTQVRSPSTIEPHPTEEASEQAPAPALEEREEEAKPERS